MLFDIVCSVSVFSKLAKQFVFSSCDKNSTAGFQKKCTSHEGNGEAKTVGENKGKEQEELERQTGRREGEI